ncbi:MAG: hypothetical protein PHE73_08865 [Sulfurovaceae bacterium]|nr:hypothetical protein [Sulfurovaceae bacterium]
MNFKPLLTSKTFWINILLFTIGIVTLPEARPFIDLKVLTLIAAVVNLILRIFFTNQPIDPTRVI